MPVSTWSLASESKIDIWAKWRTCSDTLPLARFQNPLRPWLVYRWYWTFCFYLPSALPLENQVTKKQKTKNKKGDNLRGTTLCCPLRCLKKFHLQRWERHSCRLCCPIRILTDGIPLISHVFHLLFDIYVFCFRVQRKHRTEGRPYAF